MQAVTLNSRTSMAIIVAALWEMVAPAAIPGQDLTAASTAPTVHFNHTVMGGGIVWELIGKNDFFRLERADVSGVTPFLVDGSARNHSIYIDAARNEIGSITAGDPIVGIGGVPDGNSNLQVFDRVNAVLQLRAEFANAAWETSASSAGWALAQRAPSSAIPVRIASGAPADSLIIGPGGDLGLGVAGPQFPLHVFRPTGSAGRIAMFDQTKANQSVIVGFRNSAFGSTSNSCGFDYLLRDTGGEKIAGRFVCSLVDVNPGSATAAMQFQVLDNGITNQAMKIQGGRVSIGTNASTDFLRVLNATCNGATWNNACSRELKQDIRGIPADDARAALHQLAPVTYAYRNAPAEQRVGFIAEDVPALVAMPDGKTLSPMDIVAVLTKVVQEQERELQTLRAQQAEMLSRLNALETQPTGR